jgi:DNA-binding NtrC family response regulator
VRQLRNIVRRAASVAGGAVIEPAHLSVDERRGSAPPPPSVPSSPAPAGTPPRSIEAAERQAILEALHAHGGNLTKAAEALGIHRSTLRRKMRELGVIGRR